MVNPSPAAADLVFCAATLIAAPLEDKLRAAAAGGFGGLSLWVHDYEDARARGCTDATLRRMIADHGLVIAGIDCLLDWIPGDDVPDLPMFKATEERMYRAADALGGSWINVAQAFGARIEHDEVVRSLAAICARAATRGLEVSLEFIPWSGIPDLDVALRLVGATGMPNARVAIDSWHFFRGSGHIAQLAAVRPGQLCNIQLNDALAAAPANLAADTADRLLPGEGALPIREFVAALRGIGFDRPWGIEAYSPRLAALPPEEAGRRCGDSMRRVLRPPDAN